MGLGPWEVFWIFLAILLIFGGKKIPEIARALGKGMKEFHKAKKDVTESIHEAMDDEEEAAKTEDKKEVDSKNIDTDYKSDKSETSDKT